MTDIFIICPLPLVIKAVKRAKELGGIEERWPWGDPYEKWPTERHKLYFRFIDTDKGNVFIGEVNKWVWQWEQENEPDEEG